MWTLNCFVYTMFSINLYKSQHSTLRSLFIHRRPFSNDCMTFHHIEAPHYLAIYWWMFGLSIISWKTSFLSHPQRVTINEGPLETLARQSGIRLSLQTPQYISFFPRLCWNGQYLNIFMGGTGAIAFRTWTTDTKWGTMPGSLSQYSSSTLPAVLW